MDPADLVARWHKLLTEADAANAGLDAIPGIQTIRPLIDKAIQTAQHAWASHSPCRVRSPTTKRGPMPVRGNDSVVRDRTALLVVDIQNDYLHEEGSLARAGRDVEITQAVVPRILGLVDEARSAGIPVVWVRTEHHPWTNSPAWMSRLANKQDIGQHPICVGGTWGAGFYAVAPAEGEPVVTKHRYSGFVNTDLDTGLRSMEIQSLLVAGVTTNVCVESTARDAVMRDYFVTLVGDCMAADSEAEHEASLHTFSNYFGPVVESKEIMDSWK